MNRTPAYWPTRIILGVGIVATVLALVLSALNLSAQPTFYDRPDILGLPHSLVLALAAAGVAIAGLVWMVRIFRGPWDEPPAWRYRDRR